MVSSGSNKCRRLKCDIRSILHAELRAFNLLIQSILLYIDHQELQSGCFLTLCYRSLLPLLSCNRVSTVFLCNPNREKGKYNKCITRQENWEVKCLELESGFQGLSIPIQCLFVFLCYIAVFPCLCKYEKCVCLLSKLSPVLHTVCVQFEEAEQSRAVVLPIPSSATWWLCGGRDPCYKLNRLTSSH